MYCGNEWTLHFVPSTLKCSKCGESKQESIRVQKHVKDVDYYKGDKEEERESPIIDWANYFD